jgi:hypothetical protein
MARGGAGGGAAAARRRRAKWGSPAPFSTVSAWRGRGGGGETHRWLGREEGRPEEEIDVAPPAAGGASAALRCGGARVCVERRRGARDTRDGAALI